MISMGVKSKLDAIYHPLYFYLCIDKPEEFIQKSLLERTRIKTNCCAIDGVLTAYSQLRLQQKFLEMVHSPCENSGLVVNLSSKKRAKS